MFSFCRFHLPCTTEFYFIGATASPFWQGSQYHYFAFSMRPSVFSKWFSYHPQSGLTHFLHLHEEQWKHYSSVGE